MSHIFLYGPSGTGKSSIGRILAENLRLSFVDLDQVVEANAGMSIPQIMEAKGEPAFREMENTAIHHLLNTNESVVALGGGALLRGENRAMVENSGTIILLNAQLDTLLGRLETDVHKHPLLSGDLREKLSLLLKERREHYASFPNQLSVDDKSVEQVVHQIQIMLGRHHLSAMAEYDVVVGHVSRLNNYPLQNPVIVTDENVAKFHLDAIQRIIPDAKSIILPAGEEQKNLETVSHLWYSFLQNGLDRKSTVIVFGGGVISDMAGFAAATYMRGINWVALPTTLLSMVDASLGGKTGIDLPEGKNLVGSFYPPKLVFADTSLLLTLTDRELRSGMTEVVKHGIISDPVLFDLCKHDMTWVKENLETIVKRAMAVKIKVVEDDPYEKGLRATLNLGHTVGHAVELVSQFALRHGEAIAIGMVKEARYAERIGVAQKGLADSISDVLSRLGLPVEIPAGMPRDEIINAMRVDKKKNAKIIRFALPVEIGKVQLVEVTDLELVMGSER